MKCLPANSGVFSNWLHVFHLVFRQSLPFVCDYVERWHSSCIPPCFSAKDRAVYHTWSSDNCLFVPQKQTGNHGSTATIMSRGANFPFLPFSMGLSLFMSELHEGSQTDMFIFHLWQQASSRAPNNAKPEFFFSFLHVGREREMLMRWEKCYIKTTAVACPIKNVHFLSIIWRKTMSECVCVWWSSWWW